MTSTGFTAAPLASPAHLASRATLTAPAAATVTFEPSMASTQFLAQPAPVRRAAPVPAQAPPANASGDRAKPAVQDKPAAKDRPAAKDKPAKKKTTAKAKSKAKDKSSAPSSSVRGSSVLGIAARYVGTPYRYGGTTPRGFDCSGFTGYVYRQLGVKLPRTANQQLGATKRISRSSAKPGDLVFMTSGGRAYHVGIYAGKNMMYDAPRSGKTLQKRKIWTSAVVFGRVAR